eukprot:sb/3474727/
MDFPNIVCYLPCTSLPFSDLSCIPLYLSQTYLSIFLSFSAFYLSIFLSLYLSIFHTPTSLSFSATYRISVIYRRRARLRSILTYRLGSDTPYGHRAFLNQLFKTNPTQPDLAFYLIGKFGLEHLHFWSFFDNCL